MKKLIGVLAMSSLSMLQANPETNEQASVKLIAAPNTIEEYNEIAVKYNQDLPELYNLLSKPERIFVYYLFRAGLPGNRILADQIHRHSTTLFSTIHNLYSKRNELFKAQTSAEFDNVDRPEFVKQLKTYLIYLWTNHGQYFQREMSDEKRTPNKLKLNLLTKNNIIDACELVGLDDEKHFVSTLDKVIFDNKFESTNTKPNDIANSAVNIYSPDFTDKDFQSLSPEQRSKLNAYFYIDTDVRGRAVKSMPYAKSGKYSEELGVSQYWLKKAHEHAQQHPQYFDAHLVKSLEYLIDYIEDGDEHLFKKHSIEWLKSKSQVDYVFGFIETYKDPKSHRGSFQAEATIKSFNLDKLNSILPDIEKHLPFPPTFKRETLEQGKASIPNASINNKIFGTGGLGPLKITAAYCLPNYSEIRSQHGSKQIIYPSDKSIGQMLKPEISRKLSMSKKHAEWSAKYDPDFKLGRDIWNVHCILHETIGHGSGRLATHTFKEGENLDIDGTTHEVGDTIQVTSENLTEFLAGYESTLEELRAEIIALYVSINHIDKLLENDLLSDWKNKLTQDQLIEHLILDMARTGLRRYLQQSDTATEIAGDHARANCTILYYLVDHGAIKFTEEPVMVKGKKHIVVDVEIADMTKAKEEIKNLMVLVQHIKSTGDGLEVKRLIETYGKPLRHPEYLKYLKENQKAVVNNVKVSCVLSPHFTPVLDDNGNISDVKTWWPEDIIDQMNFYESNALRTI